MPELPEVEVTRRCLLPSLAGKRVIRVEIRNAALRYPVPQELERHLKDQPLRTIQRRGKYLLFAFEEGTLIIHLGMSGSLHLVVDRTPPGKHDHLGIIFEGATLRLRDPRRFGAVIWHSGDVRHHPLIAPMGLEPLSDELTPEWLFQTLRRRRAAIKQVLMDSHTLVGVGNIYASESLFHAGIRPLAPAYRIGQVRCARLVIAIRDTLRAAVAAGGSSLRDFTNVDGSAGHFQRTHFVYGRDGEPCRVCSTVIRRIRLGQRSTFYCPRCQR